MKDTNCDASELEERTARYKQKVSALEQRTSSTLRCTLTELNGVARGLYDPGNARNSIATCLSAFESRLREMQAIQEELFQLKEETADLTAQSARFKMAVQSVLASLEEEISSLDRQHATLIKRAEVTVDSASKLGEWRTDMSKFVQVAGVENLQKASKWRSVCAIEAFSFVACRRIDADTQIAQQSLGLDNTPRYRSVDNTCDLRGKEVLPPAAPYLVL